VTCRRRHRPLGVVPVVAAALTVVACADNTPPNDRADGPRLVTNEFAYWNPDAPAARDDHWEVTGGSLFAYDDLLWSGRPDTSPPDQDSAPHTGSSVFRALVGTPRSGPVIATLDLRVADLPAYSDSPANDWDGLHVFIRYQDEASLYYVSVLRRDGAIVVKKKVPDGPSNDGTYHTLAERADAGATVGTWHHVRITVTDDSTGFARITVEIDGEPALDAVDDGVGGPPIRFGRTGLRGDNAEFFIRNFAIT
jgi:hypothetical protein